MNSLTVVVSLSLLVAFSSALVLEKSRNENSKKLHEVLSLQDLKEILKKAGSNLVVAFFCSSEYEECKDSESDLKKVVEKNTDVEFVIVDTSKAKDVASNYFPGEYDYVSKYVLFRNNQVLLNLLSQETFDLQKMITKENAYFENYLYAYEGAFHDI